MKSATSPDEHLSVFLPGELTIYTAEECKKVLDASFAHAGDVDLDLSAIESIDSAGLQLLVLAKKEALARGKKFQLSVSSPAVRDALQLSGLCRYFSNEPAKEHA